MRISRLWLVAVPILVAGLALAQTGTTSIHGTILDPAGAVVTGAEVVLSNPATGFSRTTTTDAQGVYQFVQLPPATYTVKASHAGFGAITQTVQLLVASPATVNITLQIETASIKVEVGAEAPLVNTQDASLGNAFNNQQVTALPVPDRDPAAILSLQAGVVVTASPNNPNVADYDTRSGAVMGARSDQTNINLDGIDNNDQYSGYAFSGALRSTLDSLQEFRVTTSAANADAGRSSGAQVQLVTKSGTNKFHGSAYEYHRPTFVANDWFNKNSQMAGGESNRPAKYLRNTFGGSFGGAIKKDRAFFFLNYEGMRKRESRIVTRTVPSETLRAGTIRYHACGSIDADGNCVDPGIATLTSQQITALDPLGIGPSATVMGLLNQYPTANTDSVGDGLNFRGYTFAAPNPVKWDTYIAKLDFNITQNGNHRAWVRGNLQNDREGGVPQWVYPDGTVTTPNHTYRTNSKGLAAGYTALLGANWVNNFRYGFVRFGQGDGGASQGHYVDLRGMDPIVATGAYSKYIDFPVHNFVDDLTWVHGNHTFQFGGNLRILNNETATDANSWFFASSNPSWLVNAGIAGVGNGLDPGNVDPNFYNDFDYPMGTLVGLVTEVISQYNRDKTGMNLPEGTMVDRHYKSHELEFYGQDAWRLKPNLTLTIGLRYTLLQPPYEVNGVQVQPTQDMGNWLNSRYTNMLNGVSFHDPLVFDLSGQANGKKPYWGWDKMDFAPRLALAYSPNYDSGFMHKLFGTNGQSSIRLGYGMYYDHFGEGIINAFQQFGSFGLTTSRTNLGGVLTPATAPRFTGLQDIPQSLILPGAEGAFPATFPDDYAVTWGLDDHMKTPYAHVFDLTLTRELPRNFVVEASYVGRLGKRLLMQEDMAMPLNIVDPQSGMSYFQAAQELEKAVAAGTPIDQIAPIPFWEHFFPAAAGADLLFGCSNGVVPGTAYSATQNIFDLFACVPGNATTAQQYLDQPGNVFADTCFPACSINGPWTFYSPQFASLYGWRSVGVSYYHSMVLSVRRRMARGLQFDFNYTWSQSRDMASDAERVTNNYQWGGLGPITNTWNPRSQLALSDFDARHQINANWVWEVPVGKGKKFGGGWNGVMDALLGGWSISGVGRWANSYPFGVGSGYQWATNWQLSSGAMLIGPKPQVGAWMYADDGTIRAFKDPTAAAAAFRAAYAGETGSRNVLPGPGFFSLDSGISKSWKLHEGHNLMFRWEVFNATNSVRFDAATMSASLTNTSQFGKYQQTATYQRVMQFALRYDF